MEIEKQFCTLILKSLRPLASLISSYQCDVGEQRNFKLGAKRVILATVINIQGDIV